MWPLTKWITRKRLSRMFSSTPQRVLHKRGLGAVVLLIHSIACGDHVDTVTVDTFPNLCRCQWRKEQGEVYMFTIGSDFTWAYGGCFNSVQVVRGTSDFIRHFNLLTQPTNCAYVLMSTLLSSFLPLLIGRYCDRMVQFSNMS